MSESATDAKIRDLSRRLRETELKLIRRENQLQQEITRIWRLVPSHYITLMGVYPPLRKLLHVLTEAADLQDPSRGAAIEDTMRVDFVHSGDRASTSHPEHAYTTHAQHRANVAEISKQLEWVTRRLATLIPGPEIEYQPPEGECEECGRLLFQNGTGRPRTYCSAKCRVRASRKVGA